MIDNQVRGQLSNIFGRLEALMFLELITFESLFTKVAVEFDEWTFCFQVRCFIVRLSSAKMTDGGYLVARLNTVVQ